MNTMKKSLTILTAALGLTMSAHAQYYNFDVTVHQAPSASDIIATEQMVDKQLTQRFYNVWVYEFDNVKKRFFVNAVPGLGAALAHGDWSAAWSFFNDWVGKEMDYEKRYHRASPAYTAAYMATLRAVSSSKKKSRY
jgi:hypothetical protein